MKIVGIYNVSTTDGDEFIKSVSKNINLLQDDGQTVDAQYSTNSLGNGQLAYSALILGRK